MNFEEKKEAALKSAKIAINTSIYMLLFGFFWIAQDELFPHLLSPQPEFENVDIEIIEEDYIPSMEIDSADIVNGIHEPTGLIVDTGVEDVIITCGACHSLQLVTQNRADRNGWKDIIVWMQETQKLWDLGQKEDVILDYLAKNYAPENEGRRRNIEIDEWYILN